jgi:hypothetical protein
VAKSSSTKWAGRIAYMGSETRNRILAENLEGTTCGNLEIDRKEILKLI